MNFEVTNELLEVLKPYTEKSSVSISTENEDWKGRPYQSDFVSIDEEHGVGFEVFDDEIIVFYFGDHCHFENYTSELQDGEDEYTKQAKEFLVELFENRLKHQEIYRGKKLASDKYSFIYSDDTEKYIGGTWWGLVRFLNPFAKKTEKTTIWRFDKSQGCFVKQYTPRFGWEEIVERNEGRAIL